MACGHLPGFYFVGILRHSEVWSLSLTQFSEEQDSPTIQKGLTMRLSAIVLCFVACLALAVSGCALSSKSGEAAPTSSECAASECSTAKSECSGAGESAVKSECCASKAAAAAKSECSASPE